MRHRYGLWWLNFFIGLMDLVLILPLFVLTTITGMRAIPLCKELKDASDMMYVRPQHCPWHVAWYGPRVACRAYRMLHARVPDVAVASCMPCRKPALLS